MDQFTAHLDRGWDLVQRGDTRGAEASARQALEIDPASPEAYSLLGDVAALDGDSFEAIENYRQAVALDDTYLEAMLKAAELYVYPAADFDEAINLCERALAVSESDEDIVDCLLLLFDAHLAKGDLDAAKVVVARLPDGPYAHPSHTFLVGRALYEIGDVERAWPLIEDAAKKDPMHSEAWYYLGLLRDERGDDRGATESFLRTRELDLSDPPPPWSVPRDMFRNAVESAREKLPPDLAQFVSQAGVYVSEVPGIELVADGVDPRALLLLDGGSQQDDHPSCTRIFAYQRTVERVAGSPDMLDEVLKEALEREITAMFLERPESSPPSHP